MQQSLPLGSKPFTGKIDHRGGVRYFVRMMAEKVNKSGFEASNKETDQADTMSDIGPFLERAKNGDEEAFSEIVRVFHDRVYAVAFRYVQNAEDAADMAQKAWIRAWKKLATFQQRSSFYTWMYRVVASVCLDHLRKKKRLAEQTIPDGEEPLPAVGAGAAPSVRSRPDRELEHAEVRTRFQEALDELSPEHRLAIMMREVDGYSYEEIAKIMKCRKGTVMSRIFYARKKLQERMQEFR